MATQVVMPQLGESVIEGTVGKWLKQVGDSVAQYEPIVEVITDKVNTEIPSPASGTLLQIVVAEGTTVKAGTTLAVLGEPGENASINANAHAPANEVAVSPALIPILSTTAKSTHTRLTPVVARMIAENNLSDAELAAIHGTGEGGRISKKDIENYLRAQPAAQAVPAWEQPGTGELFRPTEEVFGKPVPPRPSALDQAHPAMNALADELVPLSPMRKAIAAHMVRSKHTAPHVTTVHEADMTRVLAYQKNHAAEFEKQGVKLTLTAFFVQAALAALKAFPLVNATYTEQGIVMHRALNIGVAVAVADGLIVPVIKNADEKSLLGLARVINDLAVRARDQRLQPDEVQGGTLTLTNYGVFGSLFGTPVIPQPQSAIIGVGAIQKRAVVIDDAIAIRPMIYLALTFDHRLLDGAIGDQFMQKFKQVLETYPV